MMSGHGIEVSDWLVTSMSNGIAMKLWNLNLVPRAMLCKPWLQAWACVDAKHTIFGVCSFVFRFFLTCLRSVPHCVPNKAYGKAATHTLLTMQLQFQVSSWKSVWCLHIWRCAYSQTTFMCDHGILMTYLHFRISTSVYSQGVACGFRIR